MKYSLYLTYAVIQIVMLCYSVECHITRDKWMMSKHIDPEFMHQRAMMARTKGARVRARLD